VFSEDDRISRNVSGNNTIRSDDTVITDCYAFQNGNIAVNLDIFPDNDWRCIEFCFMPNVFWFGIEGVVVVVEFATFSDAGIVAQFYFIQTIDGNIMTQINIVSENQSSAISDSNGIMISPNHVFSNLEFGVIIQLKSRCLPYFKVRMKFDTRMRIENTVRI
jgi:hypothetical protein